MDIDQNGEVVIFRDGEDIVLIHPENRRWYFTNPEGERLYARWNESPIPARYNEQENDFLKDAVGTLSRLRDFGAPRRGCSVYLTNACNMRCMHCRYACTTGNSILDASMIESYLASERERGSSLVTFTGGEPLLCWDLLASVLPYAKFKGFRTHVLTNGSLVTDEIAAFLANNQTSVQVSLDTVDPILFHRFRGFELRPVLQGIDRLIRHGVCVKLSCSLNKLTIDKIDDVLAFAIDHSIKGVHFPMLEIGGRAEQTWSEIGLDTPVLCDFFTRMMQRYFDEGLRERLSLDDFEIIMSQIANPPSVDCCNLACGVTALHEDGIIYGCTNVCGDAQFICGYADETLSERHVREEKLLRRLPTVYDIPQCASCPFRWICLGGCRDRIRQANNGSCYAVDPYCEVLKVIYSRLVIQAVRYIEKNQLVPRDK